MSSTGSTSDPISACSSCRASTAATYFELQWENLIWPPDDPTNVSCACPACGALIEERFKTQMVEQGRWRATQPDVQGIAGFRISALISPLANARWPEIGRGVPPR